jgi:hypothetical protein
MTRSILCALALLTSQAHAQLSLRVIEGAGVTVGECNNKYSTWCLYNGDPVKVFSNDTYGAYSALDEWARLAVTFKEAYGEYVVVKSEVSYPSYVSDLTDYSNLHTAISVGSAWVKVTREYTTAEGGFRLVLAMTKDSYIVMVVGIK